MSSFKILCRLLIIFNILLVACSPEFYSWSKDTQQNQIKFIGQAIFPTGFMYEETEVGGLSAITYDPVEDLFYTISDDNSTRQPARIYKLKITLEDGKLTNNSVSVVGVIFLHNEINTFYEQGSIDAEGIALAKDYLFVSSEEQNNPFIAKFSKDGRFISALPLSDKILPNKNKTKGMRNNLGFESLTISPDGKILTTAVENALIQDGPIATESNGTLCRLFIYNIINETIISEKVYFADKIYGPIYENDERKLNGLVELISIDNKDNYFAIERSFSVHTGHVIKLFKIDTSIGSEISSISSLSDDQINSQKIVPVRKHLIFNFNEIGIPIDNIEGMTFGPLLPDGTQSFIFVGDNNFNPEQSTQFIAFSIEHPMK
jgi:hypothetical protein